MKRLFKIALILFVFMLFANLQTVYGADIDMNLSNSTPNDTVYGNSSTLNTNSADSTNTNSNAKNTNQGTSATTINVGTSSALSSSEMGASTVINIILIVVGVLLILLGIAILIRVR